MSSKRRIRPGAERRRFPRSIAAGSTGIDMDIIRGANAT